MQRWTAATSEPDPVLPARKVFKPKHKLPEVENYKQNQSEDFWSAFPSNHNLVGKSSIDPHKLRTLAWSLGFQNDQLLETVCRDLTDGADIGCRGDARNPSTSSNAPSAYEFPAQITDAIAGWVASGFAAGPFNPADRPQNAKVSGIMCREKPNGSARVILNLSAPKGSSVNDGIISAEFPTSMSSTKKWLEVLDKAGQRCLILKMDWANAYKHLAVRPEDVVLQYFNWLGMDFAELCLVFGGRSSAGLFDRLCKLVLALVLIHAKFPADQVIQYLDDICGAAAEGSTALYSLEDSFRKIADHLGVLLASTEDPDKAFSPTTSGVVLGVHYDTVTWTWSIPQEKLARLLNQIRAVDTQDQVQQLEIWSLVGRILHYAPLIPGGRYNISELIKAQSFSSDRLDWVQVTPGLRKQLHFWWSMLKTVNGLAAIPAPDRFPAWTFEFFTDASGGAAPDTVSGIWHGTGGVGGPLWFFVPWSPRINNGVRAADGKRLSRKLSALELVGPLICLSAGRKYCRRWPVRIWVDNSGSVGIWKKGYSTRCALCTTLVNAIGRVAAAIGCTVTIDKITRCSDDGSILADLLSKGKVREFHDTTPRSWAMDADPAWIPPSILSWIHNPQEDDSLGGRILTDMKSRDGYL